MIDAARERILNRVRTAVQVTAHQPPAATDAAVFGPIANPWELFRSEFAALHGELIATRAELDAFLKPFPRIATDASAIVREVIGDGNASVRSADLGVSSCDCLIAQTGSIVVSTRSTGGRAISVLPPVHLAIARRDQLVPDLAAAMAWLRARYQQRWPSALSLITGPSRTADIEKILVMGAHGPKRLALYLVE